MSRLSEDQIDEIIAEVRARVYVEDGEPPEYRSVVVDVVLLAALVAVVVFIVLKAI